VLAWLGEWLSSIVAVVLLAIVVELVLPNSKLLRYSRLVVGLILMLTMLNPILQIFQKDFHERLNASFVQWEKDMASSSRSTPSLKEITQGAEQLMQVREEAAMDVTRASLEQAILQELQSKLDAPVKEVELQIGWNNQMGGQQTPYIASVTVFLAISALQTNEDEPVESPINSITDIAIPAVSIDIDGTLQPSGEAEPTQQDTMGTEVMTEQFHKQANNIRRIVTASWNVKADQVFVQASS